MDDMIRHNVELTPYTYYKIGGPAREFAQPESVEDLRQLSQHIQKEKSRVFILGAGSNVLIDDRGFNGLVIQTSKLNRTLTQEGDLLTVGAGLMVIQLLRHCMSAGVGGMEMLVGIPGSMGGVLYMNAGTTLGEIKDVVEEISAFDLQTGALRTLSKPTLSYTYRQQHFLKPAEIIVEGKLRGKPDNPEAVQKQITELLNRRKKSQPIDKPSCGSVFKNPAPNQHAWQLIDKVGLRGYRIGGAQISEMHTNFIVNTGGASASDVRALIEEAKTRVKAQFGISLEEEVKIIAFDATRS